MSDQEKVEYSDINDLNHDPDLAIALGNLVVAWAKTETVLSIACARISGMPINQALFAFYSLPNFNSKITMLNALMKEWEDNEFNKKEISQLIEKISGISSARNKWIHGIWSKDKKTEETILFQLRKEVGKGRRSPVKAEDINNHCNSLLKLAAELSAAIKASELA